MLFDQGDSRRGEVFGHLMKQIKYQVYRRVNYHKVASSNKSRLEAHAGFFRLLMKGIFDPSLINFFVGNSY